MLIQDRKVDEVLVVSVHDERLDASIAVDFKDAMVSYINSGERQIVLDLASVHFIDSSGLGAIVSVLKAIGHTGSIKLCNLNETVMSVFKLTRMNKVFAIYGTTEEALAA